MIYEEYHKAWFKYILAKKDVDEAEDKLDSIIQRLTSMSASIKSDPVKSSSHESDLSKYIADKIDQEEVLKYKVYLLNIRKNKLDKKRNDLDSSNDSYDLIYKYRFIDKCKVVDIAKKINYTREYTYELLSFIRKNMYKIQDEIKKNQKK